MANRCPYCIGTGWNEKYPTFKCGFCSGTGIDKEPPMCATCDDAETERLTLLSYKGLGLLALVALLAYAAAYVSNNWANNAWRSNPYDITVDSSTPR